jgi:hypothetical protein
MIKALFLDMDNTIAENVTCQDVEFSKGLYLSKRPIGFMIDAVDNLLRPNLDVLVILTKVQGHYDGVDEKQEWLNKIGFRHDAFIYIEGDKKKSKFMLNFCETNGYSPDECLIIDDKKSVLQDAEKNGFKAMYPQQLLADYYEWLKNK